MFGLKQLKRILGCQRYHKIQPIQPALIHQFHQGYLLGADKALAHLTIVHVDHQQLQARRLY